MESVLSNASDLYDRGRHLMDDGDVDDAINLFQKSIELDPHFKTLELLGECFVSLNRLRESVVPLAAATALNDGVRAPAILASVFLKLGERESARRMADLALSRDPNNRKARAVMSAVAEEVTHEV